MVVLNRYMCIIFLVLLFKEGMNTHQLRARRISRKRVYGHGRLQRFTTPPKYCMAFDSSIIAHHRSCFLRPDTGPCRADILQWYFDVKMQRCYRFHWGGCQGNGNRFQKLKECNDYCFLNTTIAKTIKLQIPHFCSLTFDYGSCFGYYIRWTWDKLTKNCKEVLYSGCGGNQNNFESKIECQKTCVTPPNNTISHREGKTNCVPVIIQE